MEWLKPNAAPADTLGMQARIERTWVGTRTAADILGVSLGEVRRLLRRGDLLGVREAGMRQVRIPSAALEELATRRQRGAA